MRDALKAGLDDKVLRSVGRITLPEDPEKHYLAEFQRKAGDGVEGPTYLLAMHSILEQAAENVRNLSYSSADTNIFFDFADIFFNINESLLERKKNKKVKQLEHCMSELRQAFDKVYDTDYTPGDPVFFRTFDKGEWKLDVGIYAGPTETGFMHYLHSGRTEPLPFGKDSILCRAEPTSSKISEGSLAAVYQEGKLRAVGHVLLYDFHPASPVNLICDVEGFNSLVQLSQEDLKTTDVLVLGAKLREEQAEEPGRAGPYR